MSNDDVTDGTPAEEQAPALSLADLGLIGALARAMEEHQTSAIKPKKDAPREPLIQGFLKDKRSNLVVEVGGEKVGHYKVNTTRDHYEVDDQAALDAYAESKGEIEIVIRARPSFVEALLKRAVRNPETGAIFDSTNGEEIPGLTFVPGGKPTGTLTWTWHTHRRQPIGKAVLVAAARRGELKHLLGETPQLLTGSQPEASDE